MTPKLRHRAEHAALAGLVALLRMVPFEAAARFGAWVGGLGYRPFGIRRRVVERQIAAAFPELPESEVQRLSLGAYRNLGRTTLETALLPALSPERRLALMGDASDWKVIDDAFEAGNGAIFVLGHLGNWELLGAYTAARGRPIDVIVRRQANPLFDAFLNETRRSLGMQVIYDADAVRQVPRSLKAGRGVAFVSDQGVLGLASTFVPFFGRPAKTPRGAAVFAVRYRCPIIFVAGVRQPDGRFRLVARQLEVEDTGDREADVDRLVASFTRMLEEWIKQYPDQYFWHHRRWRRQPPDTPPELREPL
jgi:Kdo2-lipid IVA lauroyltransferase/acyltransferase